MNVVLIDLDETLSDHRHSSQAGIRTLWQEHPALQQKTVEALEHEFWIMLDSMHSEVLKGNLTLEQARVERFRRLFAGCGQELAEREIDALTERYQAAYRRSRRAVPGAHELLRWLREQGAKIVVVTNGFTSVQQGKLRECAMEGLVDHLLTSEAAGAQKPERSVFEAALQLAGGTPERAVMIGDSWQSDVTGAAQLGIKAFWLNRREETCPDPALAVEIGDLSQLPELLSAHWHTLKNGCV
ncbi:putative hydrolase of the HAD superfamily [Tumebacillus sp. BK434]|uniref:HAD family hydrolase n=1 Tax=Tumebacillus sp. BK434 TaxID=2512169 RepID=UPI0010F287B3|nr:HAD family hydrolase [Tumebacillus sp. BK434]TCP52817.1 putative hydrolase of the HAD superfamily [Tumebacillus sp. BK434]